MRILSVDFPLHPDRVTNTEFSSAAAFLDHDVVILSPGAILEPYRRSWVRGLALLDENGSRRLREDLNRRKAELSEFLALGRVLVVITPPPTWCYLTKEAARHRQEHEKFNVLTVLPETIQTVKAEGTSLQFRGDPRFEDFCSENMDIFNYHAYFDQEHGAPFLFVNQTDRIVGTYSEVGGGHVLYHPSIKKYPDSNLRALTAVYVASLERLLESLRRRPDDYKLPLWTQDYSLPFENEERGRLQVMQKEYDELLARIAEQRQSIESIERRKVILCGDGDSLMHEVAEVLKEIGFDVEQGKPGRDDLIARYGSSVAVIEVKGVSKSAAEKHAAQLEKWVSEYFSTNGDQPKGFLIVNAFKNTPLSERSEAAFPEQMLPYSKARGHCLMTTSQLLGLYYDALDVPERKDELVQSIFDTVGEYELYKDWTSYISKVGEG